MLGYFCPRECRKWRLDGCTYLLSTYSWKPSSSSSCFLPISWVILFSVAPRVRLQSSHSQMPHSSFAIHPSEKRGADENGESRLRSHLFLPSGHHQTYLVEINKPSRIWPIHGTIGYKIKQKSILNSKAWSGLSCCLNNSINPGEQSQSRWEVALVRAPQAGSRSMCGNSWALPGKATSSSGTVSGGAFLWREFLHWNTPELRGEGQSQSQADCLRRAEASRVFPPKKVLRANRKSAGPPGCWRPSLLPPALTLAGS